MTAEERARLRMFAPMSEPRADRPSDAEAPDLGASVREQFVAPGPEPAPAREPGSWGAVLRDAAIRGAGNFVRGARSAAMPWEGVVQTASRVLGGPRGNPLDPVTGVEGALERAEVFRTPDAVPTTPTQRYVGAAVEGAVGGAPFGPAGVVSGAVGGATGEGGAEIARELGLNQYGEMGGRFLGSLAGGAAGATGWSAASRLVPGRPQPALEARDRLGIPPRMVTDVTPSAAAAGATSALSRMPGAAGRIEGAANATLDDLGRAIDDVSATLTQGRHPVEMTPQQAGTVAQQGTRNWMTASAVSEELQWNQFWNGIQHGQPVQAGGMTLRMPMQTGLPNFRRDLTQVTSNLRREMPDLADNLNDPLVNSMRLIMQSNPQNMSVPALRELRSQIGRRLETSLVSSSDDMAALRRLYGSLTDDLHEVARRAGMLDVFNRANSFTRDRHGLIDRVANNVLGPDRNNPIPPEQAYAWLTGNVTQGGTRVVEAARTLLPDETGAVGATLLRQQSAPAQPQPGANVSAAQLNTFLNDQRRGVSPEARSVLYGGARQQVDDLGTVAGNVRASDRFRNSSGTAGAQEWMRFLGGAGALAGGGAAALAGGGPAAATGAGLGTGAAMMGGGLLGSNLAARAMTNEALARYMARRPIAPRSGAEGATISGLSTAAGFLTPMQRAMLGL